MYLSVSVITILLIVNKVELTKIGHFKGHLNKTWTESQCRKLVTHDNIGNPENCMEECTQRSDCSAFNYNLKYHGCSLMNCPIPAPEPNGNTKGSNGYYYDQEMTCNSPFRLIGDQCLATVDQKLNWVNAKQYCRDISGDVANLTEMAEHHLPRSISKIKTSSEKVLSYWVRGSEMEHKSNSIYVNTALRVWRKVVKTPGDAACSTKSPPPNQPDEDCEEQQCLSISIEKDNSDNICSSLQAFICEYDPQTDMPSRWIYIILGSSVIFGVLVAAAVLVFVCHKRKNKQNAVVGREVVDLPAQSGLHGSSHTSENTFYGEMTNDTAQHRQSDPNSEKTKNNSEKSKIGTLYNLLC